MIGSIWSTNRLRSCLPSSAGPASHQCQDRRHTLAAKTRFSSEAVKIGQEEFDKHQPDVIVGSSRGGAVAMNINNGDARLVLLCPAWKKWWTTKTVKPGTESWDDAVRTRTGQR
jgi:hypothetical protein